MTWLIVEYHPISFFSLRPAEVTSSGGQTLLVPSGFAFKMALLGVAIQTAGLAEGRQRFPLIRDLRIALALPEQITVLKSFARVRRPFEAKDAQTKEAKIAELAERGQYPFQSTIAYREWVQFGDPFQLPPTLAFRVACTLPDATIPSWLGRTLLSINYLGKRGGFLQALGKPTPIEELETGFIEITRDSARFLIGGTLQLLDDCSSGLAFEQVDIYNAKRLRLGQERVLRQVVLPYRLARSSRNYSLYERITRER